MTMDDRSARLSLVLQQLAGSMNAMMHLLEETLSAIRPPSTHTLPTVTATLSGVVQAAETAALAVLDEAEALQDDRRRLDAALAQLRAHLPPPHGAAAALEEIAQCSTALADRSMKFIAAMEFQDLASQHIGHVTRALEEVRGRLAGALAMFEAGEAAPEGAAPAADPIGDPRRAPGEGQALADRLLAERGEEARCRW
jgi:chemotaxis regulatin CheY-phosphate phosphatase CheZ